MELVSGVDGIYRLSLLLALTGLITIYASSMAFTPKTASITDIGRDDIGDAVSVTGTVHDFSSTEDASFFDIKGEDKTIRAVHFGDQLELEDGATYTFQGRVDIYQGELEIVVENVVSEGSPSTHPG